MIVSVVTMIFAVVLLAMASRRQAERYGLRRRLRRQVRGMGASLLLFSFAVVMLGDGGLLAVIEWVLAFGLVVPLVTLGYTRHMSRR